jgi:hypothetical protein
MPHQNVDSTKATEQNTATGSGQPNDQAREQNRAADAEPRAYAAPDVADSSLAPPAAGETADYADEGDAIGLAGQQGQDHTNRPQKTEADRGQGPQTRAANRDIVSGRSDGGTH